MSNSGWLHYFHAVDIIRHFQVFLDKTCSIPDFLKLWFVIFIFGASASTLSHSPMKLIVWPMTVCRICSNCAALCAGREDVIHLLFMKQDITENQEQLLKRQLSQIHSQKVSSFMSSLAKTWFPFYLSITTLTLDKNTVSYF